MTPVEEAFVTALLGEAYTYTAFFFGAFMVTLVFAAFVFMKTPAGVFLRASMGRKNVIINPTEHGYLHLLVASPLSRFSVHKKKKISTYYATNPEDRYTEGKSKVPCYINYGKFSFSLKPGVAFVMRKLAEHGITNWAQLQAFNEQIRESGDTPENFQLSLNPATKMSMKAVADFLEDNGFKDTKSWDETVEFAGESIDFDNIDMMFAENQRGDVIEAEIQRRTAAEIVKRLGLGGDIGKLLVIAGIVVFIVMIGFTVVMNALDADTGTNAAQAAAQAAQNAGGIIMG